MNISDNDQRAQGLFDCVVFEEWYAGLQVCRVNSKAFHVFYYQQASIGG